MIRIKISDVILYDVTFCITLLAAVVMNCIALVTYRRVSKGPTVHFLRNLAVVDMMVPLCLLLSMVTFSGCSLYSTDIGLMFAGTVSTFSVLLLVADQLVMIFYPLHYRIMFDGRKVGVLIASAWFFPLITVYGIPAAVSYFRNIKRRQLNIRGQDDSCVTTLNSKIFTVSVWVWVSFTSVIGVSISVMYLKMYIIVRQSLLQSSMRSNMELSKRIRSNKKALITTALLLANIFIFWGPLIVNWSSIAVKRGPGNPLAAAHQNGKQVAESDPSAMIQRPMPDTSTSIMTALTGVNINNQAHNNVESSSSLTHIFTMHSSLGNEKDSTKRTNEFESSTQTHTSISTTKRLTSDLTSKARTTVDVISTQRHPQQSNSKVLPTGDSTSTNVISNTNENSNYITKNYDFDATTKLSSAWNLVSTQRSTGVPLHATKQSSSSNTASKTKVRFRQTTPRRPDFNKMMSSRKSMFSTRIRPGRPRVTPRNQNGHGMRRPKRDVHGITKLRTASTAAANSLTTAVEDVEITTDQLINSNLNETFSITSPHPVSRLQSMSTQRLIGGRGGMRVKPNKGLNGGRRNKGPSGIKTTVNIRRGLTSGGQTTHRMKTSESKTERPEEKVSSDTRGHTISSDLQNEPREPIDIGSKGRARLGSNDGENPKKKATLGEGKGRKNLAKNSHPKTNVDKRTEEEGPTRARLQLDKWVIQLAYLLTLINPVIDPIIILIRRNDIRAEYRRLFFCD